MMRMMRRGCQNFKGERALSDRVSARRVRRHGRGGSRTSAAASESMTLRSPSESGASDSDNRVHSVRATRRGRLTSDVRRALDADRLPSARRWRRDEERIRVLRPRRRAVNPRMARSGGHGASAGCAQQPAGRVAAAASRRRERRRACRDAPFSRSPRRSGGRRRLAGGSRSRAERTGHVWLCQEAERHPHAGAVTLCRSRK